MMPLRAHHIPNLITAARIVLVGPLLWLLGQGHYGVALALFFVAGVSDGLDGFLAKRYGWQSRLGGFLDPAADKLLVVGCALVLGWRGDLPLWLVGLMVARDVVIVSGAACYRLLIGPFRASPSLTSKVNTLVQLLLILAVIASGGPLNLPTALVDALVGATAVFTVLSGGGYVWEWGRRAMNQGVREHAD